MTPGRDDPDQDQHQDDYQDCSDCH
jgi:hypothetical protein